MKTALYSVPAAPLRVLIVDDHVPTLSAVAEILGREAPRIGVAGTADNGAAALRLARETSPDVVVLDLDLGGESGLDFVAALSSGGRCAVVIFSSATDPALKRQAFAAGAVAFVSKLSPVEDLIAAILATHGGDEKGIGGLSCRERATLLAR